MSLRIAFLASDVDVAQDALAELSRRYGHVPPDQAQVIVALGGDGFMLRTLHTMIDHPAPVYGMNRGTVGFLMNEYREDGLIERLERSGAGDHQSAVDDRNGPARQSAQGAGDQ